MTDHRSTVPDAKMVLHLRFETEIGPRTVIVPSLTLRDASAIATAVNAVEGQYADFVDACAKATLWPRPVAKLKEVETNKANVTPMRKRRP